MNPGVERLAAYPFERLAALKQGLTPPAQLPHIPLSIGEPRHAPPEFVIDELRRHLGELDSYPATRGMPELRSAAANWASRRFALGTGAVNPETQVLPVNGTREALFASLQAGAEPYFLDTTAAGGFLPDLDAVPEDVWRRCQLLFLCSPANPVGAIMDMDYLQHALQLAAQYDFVIAADECYADIYDDEAAPPPSLLGAAAARGVTDFARCMTFHSLSKRSSLPGLRSGFVAGDARLIKPFL